MFNYNSYSLLLLFILTFNACTMTKVKSQTKPEMMVYQLSMTNPNTHYFEVEIEIPINNKLLLGKKFVDIKMATWTPGSYLIREYAKNVEGFKAHDGSKNVKFRKINKNTWRIETEGLETLKVKYFVYAFELTVRTSYLDSSHGYVNGASVFMFVPELLSEKSIVNVIPHKSFSKVSTALEILKNNQFISKDFDTLVDSPIEIGNQEILEFEALGVKHTIANYSIVPLVYDREQVISDYKKVVEAAASIVNEKHPCNNYLFIIHHLPGIGGGLEHMFSTTCHTSPDVYQDATKYLSFMGLIAHEYFHLWNIKRIRPEALGPFDYEKENYTNMLWVSEGFTSFYQDDILRRANMMETGRFLGNCAIKIGTIENSPGNKVQSVTESSWDAWIKYYRPNENSNNSGISYYTKGGVLANILNLTIISETKGVKSLDDVLRYLYNEYYLSKNRGFTDEEFRLATEKIAGIDLKSFYENQIYGTAPIDYTKYYNAVGLDITFDNNEAQKSWFGVKVKNGIVSSVEKGSDAYQNGIYVGDRILYVDDLIFTDEKDFIDNKKVGSKINIKFIRSGMMMEKIFTLVSNPNIRVIIKKQENLTDQKEQNYKKFMHL